MCGLAGVIDLKGRREPDRAQVARDDPLDGRGGKERVRSGHRRNKQEHCEETKTTHGGTCTWWKGTPFPHR